MLDLKGHISAITDLQYSFRGDRLLSASQKDGVVRIWSWNLDPASHRSDRLVSTHIVIKLSKPMSSSSLRQASGGPRRRPTGTSAVSVTCDVAVWICDDTKIATSQCEPIKQSSSTIIPGSQFLFIWDSFTGNCLLGIHGAHSMQCPVIVPHPKEPTLLCSAGSDGVLKLWDVDAGTCMFSHKNTVDFGPVDAHDRGKISGFLDGAFSPDGTALVITDENGRITIFDCAVSTSVNPDQAVPAWMREQYFRNDYYDLMYDSQGYCVERGSELPPHLAPKGVRCAHGGASWSNIVDGAFKGLAGPLPIEERAARWNRMRLCARTSEAQQQLYRSRPNVVSQCNLRTTIMLHCEGSGDPDPAEWSSNFQERSNPPHEQASSANVPRLSSNWRWGDAFNEMQDEGNDDDEPESDDEEFVMGAERRSSRLGRSSSIQDTDEDSVDDDGDASLDSLAPRRSGRRFQDDDDEDESDVESLLEFMSTNNTPSGRFVGDYETYFFKMGSEREAQSISRSWLRRVESESSYTGAKVYAPQLGDSVVYIPRAHEETIGTFPSLSAPWQNWPDGASWPVVQCCVRHMRFRFPFKSYFKHGWVIFICLCECISIALFI